MTQAATWALVLPVRSFAPAPAPYRLAKFVASQADRAVEVESPLKLLIRAWPFWLDQKSMVPAGSMSGLMVRTPLPSTFRSKAINAPWMAGGATAVPGLAGLMVTLP